MRIITPIWPSPFFCRCLDSINGVISSSQLSALPCAPTMGGKRGDLPRCSSTRPDRPYHRQYLSMPGSSSRRMTGSLGASLISLWSIWEQKTRTHGTRYDLNTRRFTIYMIINIRTYKWYPTPCVGVPVVHFAWPLCCPFLSISLLKSQSLHIIPLTHALSVNQLISDLMIKPKSDSY